MTKTKSKTPKYPEWNAEKKSESLEAFGAFLHEMAKRVFVENLRHPGIIVAFTEEADGREMFEVDLDQDNQETREFIKEKMAQRPLYAIIHSFVGSTRHPDNQGKEKKRIPALMVSVQSKDGVVKTYVDEVLVRADRVQWGKEWVVEGKEDPKLGKMFKADGGIKNPPGSPGTGSPGTDKGSPGTVNLT